jgi:hypothetical protein
MLAAGAIAVTAGAALLWMSPPQVDRAAAEQAESKVLGLLGNSPVTGIFLRGKPDVLRSLVTPKNANPRGLAALEKIGPPGKTLAETIAACRGVPYGVPAELTLWQRDGDKGVPLPDVDKQFGPPAATFKKTYPYIRKTIEFYTYGNLDVGLYHGEVVVVRVR